MPQNRETVLYYYTREEGYEQKTRQMKSIFVQMGVRIRNIEPEQVLEKVGYLAGVEGYCASQEKKEVPVIEQDMLVLHNFTRGRMDLLLSSMKKTKGSRIDLKAVVTPQNIDWTFYRLYQELLEEHHSMYNQQS